MPSSLLDFKKETEYIHQLHQAEEYYPMLGREEYDVKSPGGTVTKETRPRRMYTKRPFVEHQIKSMLSEKPTPDYTGKTVKLLNTRGKIIYGGNHLEVISAEEVSNAYSGNYTLLRVEAQENLGKVGRLGTIAKGQERIFPKDVSIDGQPYAVIT